MLLATSFRARGWRFVASLVMPLALLSASAGPVAAADAAALHDPQVPDGAHAGVNAVPPRPRPDIVLLLMDDLPQMDDRLWQRLPTIKRLFLDHGVRFTDYIGNDPLCCPGRANLLTGQWSHHHGVLSNDGRLFDPRESIATELQGVGYWTGIFGKYFNKTEGIPDKTPDGWDRSFLFSGSYWNYRAFRDGRSRRYGTADEDYSTVQIGRHAIRALRTAPADRPRFVWLSPYAIHMGRDQQKRVMGIDPAPLPEDLADPRCADVPAWSTPATREDDLTDKPAYVRSKGAMPQHALLRSCAALLSVDRMLARVLATFERQGRPEPMVILTADNGMAWGAHHWRTKFVPYATPIPLFIHWPDRLGVRPATITTTLTNVDIAPTLCAIAGCQMGPFPNGFGVDGISFLPLLLAKGGTLGREVVFEEHPSEVDGADMPGWTGVRTTDESPIGRWVYTRYRTGEQELYDVSGGPCWSWQAGDPGDPCQLQNRSGDPAVADVEAALRDVLARREQHPLRIAP